VQNNIRNHCSFPGSTAILAASKIPVQLLILLAATLSLSACNEQKNNVDTASADQSYSGRTYSVLGQLRPKEVDPAVLKQIQDEEEAQRKAKLAEIERQQKEMMAANYGSNPANRDLPGVNMGTNGNLPSVTSTINTGSSTSMPDSSGQSWAAPVAPPPPPASASYPINYTNPSPGFVPPPPAVSLSTQAVPMGMPYGSPPPDYANPYAYMQQAPQGPPQRQAGGLFGTSSTPVRNASDDDDDSPRKKKVDKPIQIITPTGMESRSAFKQRDEIRILWKGALASSLGGLANDGKFADSLAKIDVGLPSESSKGSLSVPQRQIDNLFKNTNTVDKKIYGAVKKAQTDLVQAYYRYLYSYNKFFLTQQQIAARKQELDAAESQAEKQRATVDLVNAQQDADSSKDDMRSAQSDLASIVGAPAARTVITRVSGVSPSLDSLASDSPPQAQDKGGEGGIGGLLNVFNFGKKSSKEDKSASADAQQVASADTNKGKEKKEKKEKESKDKKKGKGDEKQIAAKPAQDSASSKADATETAAAPPSPPPSGPVSFELKDVKTTPRKSVLRVVVKNTGGDNFNFDADSISVAEGNNKLAEASVSAEFDSTVVQPSQEVTGTITIFGRPWNDKITVSLSDGKKPIVLHR
jgi:archaellum component FlaG (FlaF/FlaG flagellin family)